MPSILSRLLGRKKSQEPEALADKPGFPTPLLEGKFEVVSPTVSPSAAFFTDPGAAQIRGIERPKDKESPLHLLRARSRASSDLPAVEKVEKAAPNIPHLSLNLPVIKEHGRALDAVFESGTDALALLNETTIRERRLTPHEVLSLVRACSQVILERGLETLGVMHPHWHSASPEVQQRLISLYILSLASTSPNDATSPSSPTAPATFDYELQYTCSPHDAAAIFRWGLRHLKFDGDSFGKESGDWTWYNTFAEAERTSSYPPDAFSKFLIPRLPTAHTELLLATLDIISSLSTRSEANGSSGSKLSKFFGLWLLTCGHSTEGDDWRTFYDRWDDAGRNLEHLFLARIRNDASRLPRRLTDLVEHYPPRDGLLPRPRFSTRQHDALLVRLETEYTGTSKPKSHPLRLIADALRAQSTSESTTPEDAGLWDAIKKTSLTLDAAESSSDAAPTEPIPIFSNVFSDETIRLLSLIPVDMSDKDKPAPSFILKSPISTGRPRSFSFPDTPLSPVQADRGRPPPSRQAYVVPALTASNSTAPTTASPVTPTDWLQFSSNGFGTIPGSRDLAGKLWDNDVEVTLPPPAPLSRKSSRRAQSRHSRHSRHSSLDSARTPVAPLPAIPAILISKTTLVAKVKLDEAFIDFWADSLLDPVLKNWPRFVLCQLKPLPPVSTSASPTPTWLIIEQRLVPVVPVAPPVKEEVEATVPPARPRPSSPRPESSRLSSAFSIASKRFTFFTGGSSEPKSPREKTTRLPLVGEFGESDKGRGDSATEATVKGSINQGVASALTTVGATVLAVASTATASEATTQVKITQKPKDDGLPIGTTETAPELTSVSGSKANEIGKDELPHSAATQNGLTHDDEGQHERKSKTVPAPGPAAVDALVPSSVTSESVKAGTEPLVSGAEVEITQPEPTSVPVIPYLAGISGSPPPQAKAVPELSAIPVVEGPVVPAPAVSEMPILEESKSVELPAAELTPVPVPPAPAIEEPVVDEVAATQAAEHELVVKVKAPEQDLPADEVAPDSEPTHTFEQVSAPVVEVVTVSEIPEAIREAPLPEGRVGELPTSDAVPVPVSEKTVPQEDKSTMREVQVATSADSDPIIVADSSVTELEPVPTDEASPAIQTSPVDEGQAADSVDAVETTSPLEEPVGVVGEPVIEEDAQPAAIPQRDDSILEESKEMEATATESATEPHLVYSDTVFPAVEKAESSAVQAAPEAPAANDGSDVEHAVVATQPIEESIPTHVTHEVQDAIVEEQQAAEEINPIPEASTSESISAGGPATSHDDETDAAPVESAVTENIPPVEPTTSSGISPPEVLEEPVIEAAPEPTSTDSSAEPLVDHTEQVNAEATVLINRNESTTSPIDEVSTPKGQPSTVAESQATANELESVVPCEEPLAPAPEESVSVVEEPAPSEAEILVETPAPAAHEAESLSEEPAVPATETLIPAPVTEAEEPVTDETTSPEVAEAAIEAPVSVPAIEEPSPLLEEVVPVTAEAATDPTPLPEDSSPITESAVTDTSVPDEPGPVVEEDGDVVEEIGPVVELDGPVVEQDDPVVELDDPVVEQDGPVVEQDDPVVEQDGPVVEQDDPVVELDDPVVEQDGPVVEQDDPIVGKDDPLLEEDHPVVEEHPPILEEHPPVLEEHLPILEEQPPVLGEHPPVLEEDPPVLEENPVVKRDDPVVEEDGPVVEDEPAVPELTVENSAPLPEDLAPATESAAPNETPVESLEHDEEGLPTSEPAAAVAEESAPSTEDKAGLENVEVDPVVEDSLPPEEQVAQETLTASGVDTTTASEPESAAADAAADSMSSETNGTADATSW